MNPSLTPRTDAAIQIIDVAFVGADGLSSEPGESVEPSFARELERENQVLREEVAEYRVALQKIFAWWDMNDGHLLTHFNHPVAREMERFRPLAASTRGVETEGSEVS